MVKTNALNEIISYCLLAQSVRSEKYIDVAVKILEPAFESRGCYFIANAYYELGNIEKSQRYYNIGIAKCENHGITKELYRCLREKIMNY